MLKRWVGSETQRSVPKHRISNTFSWSYLTHGPNHSPFFLESASSLITAARTTLHSISHRPALAFSGARFRSSSLLRTTNAQKRTENCKCKTRTADVGKKMWLKWWMREDILPLYGAIRWLTAGRSGGHGGLIYTFSWVTGNPSEEPLSAMAFIVD